MKRLLLAILIGCSTGGAIDVAAQTVVSNDIRPGKEKLVLELPKEQRWRGQRISKEVPSIRGWSYTPTRGDTTSLPVRKLETSTIDRRYYPVNARRTLIDKVTFIQQTDPGARVEILHDQLEENRTSVIYAIFPGEPVGEDSTLTLMLAAEGPTAFHSVEIPIPAARASRELLMEWVEILRATKIQ